MSTSAGILGAVALPSGKQEAERLLAEGPDQVALSATTLWLPQKAAHYLSSLESAPKDMQGRPLRPIPVPALSETEAKQLKQSLWMLDKALTPASSQPELLMEAIQVAMSELQFRSRSSEEQVSLTLKVWCDACRAYPLWAVQKAAGWWSRGARDGDDLGHFLSDVRLAVGHGVTERRKLLSLVAPDHRQE